MAFDLDKARAARAAKRETEGEGPQIIIDGITYELAPELPYGVLEGMQGMALGNEHVPAALVATAKALLGKHYDAFVASEPSVEDLNDLVGGILEEYGVEHPLPSSGS